VLQTWIMWAGVTLRTRVHRGALVTAGIVMWFISALAGTALLGSTASSMGAALSADQDRLAAAGTLAVTVSGITLMGVGSAFWGLVFGLVILALDRLLTIYK